MDRTPHARIVGRMGLRSSFPGFVLAACCAACGADEPTEPRVLVLAVDGFEWSVVRSLLEAGEMPNLAQVMQRGTHGVLSTLEPTKSPVLWTTIATGKTPDQHGIVDFLKEPEVPGGRRELYTSRDRRVKAFWNILSDNGISCDVVGWWLSWPVEPISGWMVSQTNTLRRDRELRKGGLLPGVPDQVWPEEAREDVSALIEAVGSTLRERLEPVFGEELTGLDALEDDRWRQCQWAFRADLTYLDVLRLRAGRGELARVSAVYLGATDVVGHRFWAAWDPEPFGLDAGNPECARYGHVIPAYYRFVDRALGDLLALFPENTRVLVVSDHGMTPIDPPDASAVGGVTGNHDRGEPGVFVAAGPGIARDRDGWATGNEPRVLGTITDFCPTLLALVGVPYGSDMAGEPMAALFEPTFLTEHPIASIDTHETPGWRSSDPVDADDGTDDRLRQLEQLGYVTPDGADSGD